MASHQQTRGGASALPLNLIAQAVPKLTRDELENLCERLVDALDEIDGESDVELNGDELDGSGGEDDFKEHCPGANPGPGCPISDPDCSVDDNGCDEVCGEREPEDWILPECSSPAARAEHLHRIRWTRCIELRERDRRTGGLTGPVYGWSLWSYPTVPTKRQILKRKRGVPKQPRP